MDVKTRKQKASALVRRGATKKALAVYLEILEHLEGTKGILREVPLYVKAGDVCVVEGDTKAALAMYDKAGQLYAKHGSGKSVIAVCGKILDVLPEGINTHLHYARLLIEGGHVGEARKVMVNYAAVFDFTKVRQALEIMEGRSDDDVTLVLEMVLEMAVRSGEEAAEPQAKSESPEIAELEEGVEEAELESAVLDSLDPVDMESEVAQPDIAQPGDYEEEQADAGEELEISKGATDMLEKVAEEAELESAVLDSLDPVDMEPEVAQPDIAQPGDYEEEQADAGEELEISKATTDLLEERPVAGTSGITRDIVSEFEKSDDQDDEAQPPADSGSVIVKSGEDWEVEESSIAAREEPPEEEPTAPVRPEIPVADVPAPAAVRDPTSVPNINLTPPEGPPKLVTMEDTGALQDLGEELKVDRFSEGHPEVDMSAVDMSSDRADTVWPAKPVEPITPRPAPVRPSGSARVATPQPRPSTPQRRASASRPAPGRRGRGRPEPRKSRRLTAIVLVIIAVVIGLVLWKLGLFGGRRPAAVANSSADGGAAVAQDVRSTPTPIRPTDGGTLAQFPPVDSILDFTDIELGPVPAGWDSVPADALGATESVQVFGPPPVDSPVSPAEPAKVPLISVEGLVVATVRTLIAPGRTGYRLVQLLDSGERLTLTVFPIAAGAAATMTDGAVQVTSNPDGTAEGIVRFGDYEVRARAAVSTELLEVLLEQLVEGAGPGTPPN